MRSIWVGILSLELLLLAAPAFAHHSFAAEFDAKKPVTVTVVITKVALENPHSMIQGDAKDADGKVVHWTFLGGVPAQLRKTGLSSDTKPGTVITVEGYMAKNGLNFASISKLVIVEGRETEQAGGTQEDTSSAPDKK